MPGPPTTPRPQLPHPEHEGVVKCLVAAHHGARLLLSEPQTGEGPFDRPDHAPMLSLTPSVSTAASDTWEAAVGNPISQMRRRRPGQVDGPAQSHPARMWQSQALNQVRLQSAPCCTHRDPTRAPPLPPSLIHHWRLRARHSSLPSVRAGAPQGGQRVSGSGGKAQHRLPNTPAGRCPKR